MALILWIQVQSTRRNLSPKMLGKLDFQRHHKPWHRQGKEHPKTLRAGAGTMATTGPASP
jgi:hypothetical protein